MSSSFLLSGCPGTPAVIDSVLLCGFCYFKALSNALCKSRKQRLYIEHSAVNVFIRNAV